jgi:phosphate uptake regulator
MNSQQQHIHTLRTQLLAMSRLSQRALDYSIKGYEMRNLDFSCHVRTADNEIEEHHRRIKELCRKLMNEGAGNASDSRFAFAAAGINTALHVTYTAAAEIAQDSIRLLESSGIHGCDALERMGQLVNGSMRLCIVALFEKNAAHAENVLRRQGSSPLRELTSIGLHPHIDRWAGAQGDFERSVIRSLTEVAKQAHEIADAILFWLEEKPCVPVSRNDTRLSYDLPSALQPQEAASLSYMQSKNTSGSKNAQRLPC